MRPTLRQVRVLPDQLTTDKGGEWDLVVFAMHLLARRCPARAELDASGAGVRRSAHRYVYSKRNVQARAPNNRPASTRRPSLSLPTTTGPLVPHADARRTLQPRD